jgi:hypothetical protein
VVAVSMSSTPEKRVCETKKEVARFGAPARPRKRPARAISRALLSIAGRFVLLRREPKLLRHAHRDQVAEAPAVLARPPPKLAEKVFS